MEFLVCNASDIIPERNTIILREMPDSATQEQVEAVFSWDGCPQVKSVHPDVGYYW